MIVKINNLPINVIYNAKDIITKTPILFLHGFTGSANDWDFVNGNIHEEFTPIFIDLIGHGNSDSPNEVEQYSEKCQVEIINELLKLLSISKLILVGYSMGGRIALSYNISYPDKVKGLVLESTSYGIEDENERNERIKNDYTLAKFIESDGIVNFINHWMSIPLFQSLAKIEPSKVQNMKEIKIASNNPIGLKNSLLGFSAGGMNFHGNSLSELKQKVLLIAGEFDTKFCNIAKNFHKLLPNSEIKIVNDCGHNVHFEKPEEFLNFLNTFLLNIKNEI